MSAQADPVSFRSGRRFEGREHPIAREPAKWGHPDSAFFFSTYRVRGHPSTPRRHFARTAHPATRQDVHGWRMSWGREEAGPTPQGAETMPDWTEQAKLSQQWPSEARIHLRSRCYPLGSGPWQVVSESIRRAVPPLSMRSVVRTAHLGFHKVTRFLVAGVVLEPGPRDFPARTCSTPSPHLYR